MDGASVQVSFFDSAAAVHKTDLARVRAADLVAGRPWRVFRWHRGQAHYSGWYWSATMGRHVVYESRLELARLMLADFDPRVASIAAQPFHIAGPSQGRTRRHVPDFLVVDRDGVVSVVNVKPAARMRDPKVAAALSWAGSVFAERGWRHEIWSGAPANMLANVRFLAAYRHGGRVDADVVAGVQAAVTGPVSIHELEAAWPQGSGEVRPAVLHLIWRGVLVADLSAPLSGSSVVERVA